MLLQGTSGWGCPPTVDGTVDPTCSMDGQAILNYYEIMDINKVRVKGWQQAGARWDRLNEGLGLLQGVYGMKGPKCGTPRKREREGGDGAGLPHFHAESYHVFALPHLPACTSTGRSPAASVPRPSCSGCAWPSWLAWRSFTAPCSSVCSSTRNGRASEAGAWPCSDNLPAN